MPCFLASNKLRETVNADCVYQRPDLRPPKFSVDVVSPEAVSPGYWFLAAYVDLNPKEEDSKFRPFQTGPHIYDNQGVRMLRFVSRKVKYV